MTKNVSQPGGPASSENLKRGYPRQLRVDETRWELRVHDGVTPGGHRIPNAAGVAQMIATSLASSGSTGTLNVFSLESQLRDAEVSLNAFAVLGEGGKEDIFLWAPGEGDNTSIPSNVEGHWKRVSSKIQTVVHLVVAGILNIQFLGDEPTENQYRTLWWYENELYAWDGEAYVESTPELIAVNLKWAMGLEDRFDKQSVLLTTTIPADLAPGLYSVAATNPDLPEVLAGDWSINLVSMAQHPAQSHLGNYLLSYVLGTEARLYIKRKQANNWVRIDAGAAFSTGDIKTSIVNADQFGWLRADGRLLSRASYPALFAAIGTTYNTGTVPSDQFRIPDFRGMFLRGLDSGRGLDPTAGRALGSVQQSANKIHTHNASSAAAGSHTHTVTLNETGAHTHTGTATSAGNHTHTGTAATNGAHTHSASSGSAGNHSHSGSTASGGGHTHNVPSGYNNGNLEYAARTREGGGGSIATNSAGAHTHTLTTNTTGAHTHTISVASDGAHSHTVSTNNTGAHTHAVTTVSAGAHTHTATVSSAANHTHTITVADSDGESESRPVNMPVVYLIKT